MGTNSYADYIRHWGQIDDRMKVNPQMAPFEELRVQLEVERIGLVNATNRQAALKGETQDTTREIEGHVARGREVATRLRDAVRAQFGREGEKLTEFGLKVRRPTAAKAAAKSRAKNKKPSEKGPNPDQAATSETDGTT